MYEEEAEQVTVTIAECVRPWHTTNYGCVKCKSNPLTQTLI